MKARVFSIFDDWSFREKHNSYRCIEYVDKPLANTAIDVIEKGPLMAELKAVRDSLKTSVRFMDEAGYSQLDKHEPEFQMIDDNKQALARLDKLIKEIEG